MDKKKQELIIAGILVVVFIIILSNNLLRGMRRKISPDRPQVSAEILSSQKVGSLFKTGGEEIREKVMEKELGWGRDPFVLEEAAQSGIDTIAGLKLMGITADEKAKPMAVINNEIVSAGSRIGKFIVLKIFRDKVTVNDGEKSFELKMNQ